MIARLIATWFYCGYWPVGPGTAGSAAAVAIAWALHRYAGWPPLAFAPLAAALAIPGVWAATETARAMGKIDPGAVVVDEVIGQWITIAGALALNWKSWLIAFALFRIFDVWKPFPIRRLERLPGGYGIIADDALAGVYGAAVLFALGWFHLY